MEHRWLGLDRRSIPYALVAFAVLALWAWVMPWIDDQVAWDDTTRTGEAFQVTEDVTMVVPPGWGVVGGLRTSDDPRTGDQAAERILLVKNGVVVSVAQGPFDESPVRLLDQAERITGASNEGYHVSGETRDVTTTTGLRGVSANFTTPETAGAVTAFVVDGRGIEIQTSGLKAQLTAMKAETDAMIDSLAKTGGES